MRSMGDPEVAKWIDLPSPPLPPNPFSDQPLDVNLAHEIVRLAGLPLIYKVKDETSAKELVDNLPKSRGYEFKLWFDIGSTEVLILSSKHNEKMGYRGKILVLFRGSEEPEDWLLNVRLTKGSFGPPDKIVCGELVAKNIFGFNKTYDVSHICIDLNSDNGSRSHNIPPK